MQPAIAVGRNCYYYILRAKRSCELEAEEIRSTEEEEVCHLMTTKGTCVPLLVRQFNLYLHEKGLLRCRERIQNSLLNQEFKTTMLLPSRYHVVDLII